MIKIISTDVPSCGVRTNSPGVGETRPCQVRLIRIKWHQNKLHQATSSLDQHGASVDAHVWVIGGRDEVVASVSKLASKRVGSSYCNSSLVIHVQSESGRPRQRTKKRWTIPSLVKKDCSALLGSLARMAWFWLYMDHQRGVAAAWSHSFGGLLGYTRYHLISTSYHPHIWASTEAPC